MIRAADQRGAVRSVCGGPKSPAARTPLCGTPLLLGDSHVVIGLHRRAPKAVPPGHVASLHGATADTTERVAGRPAVPIRGFWRNHSTPGDRRRGSDHRTMVLPCRGCFRGCDRRRPLLARPPRASPSSVARTTVRRPGRGRECGRFVANGSRSCSRRQVRYTRRSDSAWRRVSPRQRARAGDCQAERVDPPPLTGRRDRQESRGRCHGRASARPVLHFRRGRTVRTVCRCAGQRHDSGCHARSVFGQTRSRCPVGRSRFSGDPAGPRPCPRGGSSRRPAACHHRREHGPAGGAGGDAAR